VVADSAPTSACPNGGITVTDGNNDTGYVCNGANGSPGPSGSSGPVTAGQGGLNVTVVTNSESVPLENFVNLSVECPAAEPYVLGGGGSWDTVYGDGGAGGPAGGPYIAGESPIVNDALGGAGPENGSEEGWHVFAYNDEEADTLDVWAICSA
jgi:hypothetical protein